MVTTADNISALQRILASEPLFQNFPYSVFWKVNGIDSFVTNSSGRNKLIADCYLDLSSADFSLLVEGHVGFAELYRSGGIVATGNNRALLLFSLVFHATLNRYFKSLNN
ncbi:MAG: hypothetical protein PHC51_06365 [bacterium]|nr:hypothetical protein [bacterium]